MRVFIFWIILIIFPYSCWVLSIFVAWGLIPLALETLYFLPISWIGEPLFTYTSDIGGYLTSHFGRLFGVIVYSVIYWSIVLFFKKNKWLNIKRIWGGKSKNIIHFHHLTTKYFSWKYVLPELKDNYPYQKHSKGRIIKDIKRIHYWKFCLKALHANTCIFEFWKKQGLINGIIS